MNRKSLVVEIKYWLCPTIWKSTTQHPRRWDVENFMTSRFIPGWPVAIRIEDAIDE